MRVDEVYLDGTWLPRDQARVSAFDRGFIFGDGVYELVPAYGRKPFCATGHVARLEKSLRAVGIKNPHSAAEWHALVAEAARRSVADDARIYLQVTRGVAPRLHRFPEAVTPTVFMFADPLVLPDAAVLERGLAAVTQEDFRWLRGDIKSISLMAAVMASERAAQAGAVETIFVRAGVVTDGASSNVLLARGGELFSPVVDRRVLAGVTLALLDEIASQKAKLTFRDLGESELRTADEVLVCSSGREVIPITVLDGETVGTGKPGPLYHLLRDGLRARVRRLDAA